MTTPTAHALAPSRARLTPARLTAAVALGGAATIGGALFIEHALGVKPCELCLVQRIPYYAGVPLAAVAAWAAARRPRHLLTTALVASAALEAPSGAGRWCGVLGGVVIGRLLP